MANGRYLEDDELEDGPLKPDTGVSDRVAPPSQNIEQQNGVKDFLSKQNASRQPATDLESDPLMAQYMRDQSDLNDYRQVKQQADTSTNLGQSLSQLAMGANTPKENPVFKNIATQNQEMLGSKEKDMDRRRKVMDAIESRKAREEFEAGRRADRSIKEKELGQHWDLARQDRQDKEGKLSEKQLGEVQDFDDSIDSMKSIMGQLGNHSEWTGAIDGRLPDAVVGADQVAFRSELGRMVDKYRKLITGAGASNQELKKLEGRLPSATDTYSNFVSKSKNFIDQVERAKGRLVTGLKSQGKNVKPFESTPTSQSEKSASDKIVVSNGQETLSIDPSDLADAEKDGFKRL